MKKILILLLALTLIGCEPKEQRGPVIAPEHDRTGETFRMKVITYQSVEALNAAQKKWARENDVELDNAVREGWSGWNLKKPYYCEVHVVAPTHVDDDNTLTLGHEVVHCIYGTYHPEF